MSIDVYVLPVFPLPHQFRCWISVRLARERDILILTNRHRAFGGQRVQNVGRHLGINRKKHRLINEKNFLAFWEGERTLNFKLYPPHFAHR